MRQVTIAAVCVHLGCAGISLAHTCGPSPIQLVAGGPPATYQITADLTEDVSLYTPTQIGDPAVAVMSPETEFEAHHGVFTFQPVGKGVAEFRIHWFYEPTGFGDTCTVLVLVKDPCQVAITGSAEATAGSNVNLTATLQNGSPGASYSWEVIGGAGELVAADGASSSVTSDAEGEVTVRVTVTDPACGETVTATHTIVFGGCGEDPDTIVIVALDASRIGSPVTLAAIFRGADGDVSYEWRLAGGVGTLTSDGSRATVNAQTAGTLVVEVLASDGLCGNTVQATHSIVFTPLPCPFGSGDTHCQGMTIDGSGGPGVYTVAVEASDDSGDPVLYTFLARDATGVNVTVGPQTQNTATFTLGQGEWTIYTLVDDGKDICAEHSPDASCAAQVTVEPAPVNPVVVRFHRGDGNGDGVVDISDALSILNRLFIDGLEPQCLDAADANDDGEIDISDPVRILNHLFLGSSAPPDPGIMVPGSDPTEDALDCMAGVEGDPFATLFGEKLCKIVEFAEQNGIALAWNDLFHVHIILGIAPEDRPPGNTLPEPFLVQHYKGMIGHAREFMDTRAKVGEPDNFNVFLDGCGMVRFHGDTVDEIGGFDPEDPTNINVPDGEQDPIGGSQTVLGGLEGGTIYFRYCEEGEVLPRGIRRVQKGEKFLCFGLRPFWPDRDAALGVSPGGR